jgi:hypothetical protein
MDGRELAVGSTGSQQIDGDARTIGRSVDGASDGLAPPDVNSPS